MSQGCPWGRSSWIHRCSCCSSLAVRRVGLVKPASRAASTSKVGRRRVWCPERAVRDAHRLERSFRDISYVPNTPFATMPGAARPARAAGSACGAHLTGNTNRKIIGGSRFSVRNGSFTASPRQDSEHRQFRPAGWSTTHEALS
jgi:hypothetical protein